MGRGETLHRNPHWPPKTLTSVGTRPLFPYVPGGKTALRLCTCRRTPVAQSHSKVQYALPPCGIPKVASVDGIDSPAALHLNRCRRMTSDRRQSILLLQQLGEKESAQLKLQGSCSQHYGPSRVEWPCQHTRAAFAARRHPLHPFAFPTVPVSHGIPWLIGDSSLATYRYAALNHQPIQLVELAHHCLSLPASSVWWPLKSGNLPWCAVLSRRLHRSRGNAIAPSSSATPSSPFASAPGSASDPRPPCSRETHLLSSFWRIP